MQHKGPNPAGPLPGCVASGRAHDLSEPPTLWKWTWENETGSFLPSSQCGTCSQGSGCRRGLWDPDPGDILIPLCLERCILFVPWSQAFSVPFPRVTLPWVGVGAFPRGP